MKRKPMKPVKAWATVYPGGTIGCLIEFDEKTARQLHKCHVECAPKEDRKWFGKLVCVEIREVKR